jgi:S1-C subfamily serine protease
MPIRNGDSVNTEVCTQVRGATRLATLVLAFLIAMMAVDRPVADEARPSQGTTRRASPSEELNTLLMHATFRVHGPAKEDPLHKVSFGTVFVMGIPRKDDPKLANIVLVTAAHVLDDIDGDVATLLLRKPNDDATYTAFPYDLPIRIGGRALYTKHPTADVAVMYADLPDEVPMTGLGPAALATDQSLQDIEVHPGDEAFVLGFPLGIGAPGAFPILRTGRIASYPLTPMKTVKQMMFDVFIYGGNSGGPVYYSYSNRTFKGAMHFGMGQGILGLVIQQANSPNPEFAKSPLNLDVVVPAVFIHETLERLPPLDDPPTGSVNKP